MIIILVQLHYLMTTHESMTLSNSNRHSNGCVCEGIAECPFSLHLKSQSQSQSQKYFIPTRPQYSMHKSETSTQSSKEKATQKGESR